MKFRRYSCMAAAVVASAVVSSQVWGSAPLGAGAVGVLSFAFVVEPMSPESPQAVTGRAEAGDAGILVRDARFKEGELLSSGTLLDMLQPRTDVPQVRGHAYENAMLLVELRDEQSGTTAREAVAQCGVLDFEYSEGAPFPESVTCDGVRFEYAVAEDGITVVRDGVEDLRYVLSSGTYMLNGVPFLIR